MRQRDPLHYTDSLMSDVKTLARKKSTYDHLAAYILNNYEGVLVTRNDPDGNLSGYVFKRNGKGYPRLKSNGTIQAPIGRDYAGYQNHAPLSGAEIPTEALIVGLADRYDALRSRRPYKDGYSHEKTLAVLTKDDRSGINGGEWYGVEIWHMFEKHHLHFKEMFEGMQN